ncbi:MAG: sulfite exporter TauE/SafE family protein [Actinobacteria bacterium]|nr:sulfite exporter TauE/SafE family protein [Actinomycetota bacterium]
MDNLLLVALAGFLAAMVDGALGMGFGPTSSTLLLSAGIPPAAVSTTVNLAKVASGLAAGVSHWRFRNIDHRLVLQLAIPGAIGAVIGVTVLTHVPADTIRPLLAALLVLVGLRMLLRFSKALPARVDVAEGAASTEGAPRFDERGVKVVATAGGVTNGLVGAWGPVVTPFLMHKGLEPRFAIGSVNTAEVAVATVAAGSLVASLGRNGFDVGVVVAMMVGGVLAAPLAAWVIRFVPARGMGVAVAALLLLTNVRDLASWGDLGSIAWAGYGIVVVLALGAALAPRLRERRLSARWRGAAAAPASLD